MIHLFRRSCATWRGRKHSRLTLMQQSWLRRENPSMRLVLALLIWTQRLELVSVRWINLATRLVVAVRAADRRLVVAVRTMASLVVLVVTNLAVLVVVVVILVVTSMVATTTTSLVVILVVVILVTNLAVLVVGMVTAV